MKRRLGALTLGLCLAAALCTPALAAAAPAAPVVEHKTADSFTVTYQGTAKNQYVLLVVKAGTDLNSLTADSILYIDQAAADENGVAAFANLTDSTKGFLLKSSQSADVYVGGAELAAPAASKFEAEKVGQDCTYTGGGIYFAGVPVMGSVSLQGRSSHAGATVTLTKDGAVVGTATTESSGAYTFGSIPAGNYTLKITMPGYLSYTKTTLTVEGETSILAETLLGGDINGDTQVTIKDLSSLLANYGQVTSDADDINGDTQVTIKDLSVLLANYGVGAIVND